LERRTPPGASPGTLIADPNAPRPIIRVIAYSPDGITEQTIENVEYVRNFVGKWPVTWINVDGLGDATVISKLGEIFELHRLAMEDVLGVHQRAKVEQYTRQYFIVARMADSSGERFETEQLSFRGRATKLPWTSCRNTEAVSAK